MVAAREGRFYEELVTQFQVVTLLLWGEFLAAWVLLLQRVLPGKREIALAERVARDWQVKAGKQGVEGGKIYYSDSISQLAALSVWKQAAPLVLGAHRLFFCLPLAKPTRQVRAEASKFVSSIVVLLSYCKSL